MNGASLALLERLAQAQARRSFWAFRQAINPRLKRGWWQREIAHLLQRYRDDLVAGKRPKLVIEAPPQHGKSTIIIDFIAWLSGHDPDCKTIYTSFSERLGVRANLRLQRVFTSERFRRIFPGASIGDGSGQSQRNRELLEFVGCQGYFRNTTVRGSITGESLDLGVIDDPIKGREEAQSQTIRDKTWEWLTDDFFTRFSENAGLLAILTRWHVDDPIGRLIGRMPDVQVARYPAIAQEDEKFRKKGQALFPEHKSLEFLLERRAVMNRPYWEAIYQQNPVIAEGNIFKPGQLLPVEAIPAGAIEWVRGWDLGATVGGDPTAGAKLGKLPDGRYIIADMVHGDMGPDERDALMRNTAAQDGNAVTIGLPQDPGQAGKTQALHLTRMLQGYRVKSSPESGDKITRAEPFASQVNVGNVLMLKASWNERLIEEMRMFPNGRHDDQIDALARAFGELIARPRSFFG